ncbi:MAG TPA: acetyl-CoA carboxylase biotin carboxyl carrier protein [Myxococcaceae bacterium]|nr:acetyl-CoA carboxylase biotin carboxyl carrier protein [Myxococcaceae bacterium]
MASKRKDRSAPARAAGVSTSSSLDVEALREIVDILEGSEVTRLVWRSGNQRLIIRRGPPPAAPAQHVTYTQVSSGEPQASSAAPVARTPSPSAPAPAAPPVPEQRPGTVVTSPFVGTFYRTPAPDQPSFVEIGTQVRKGQVLCIVEAMKLMNEIESEVAGRVAEILVQNGQPVEFGQPLFRIEPA